LLAVQHVGKADGARLWGPVTARSAGAGWPASPVRHSQGAARLHRADTSPPAAAAQRPAPRRGLRRPPGLRASFGGGSGRSNQL